MRFCLEGTCEDTASMWTRRSFASSNIGGSELVVRSSNVGLTDEINLAFVQHWTKPHHQSTIKPLQRRLHTLQTGGGDIKKRGALYTHLRRCKTYINKSPQWLLKVSKTGSCYILKCGVGAGIAKKWALLYTTSRRCGRMLCVFVVVL